jgi:hypothetical protein
MRRTLRELHGTGDDTTEDTAAARERPLHTGMTTALRSLHDLVNDTDGGEQE